jgi:2-keto-3-deoxy-L-fuconate dehydrogenase
MEPRLSGKRILITQAEDYMGPAFAAMFRQHGAQVVEDSTNLVPVDAAAESDFFAGQAIPFGGGWAQ